MPFALAQTILDEKSRDKIAVVDDDRVKLEGFVNPADIADLFGPNTNVKER